MTIIFRKQTRGRQEGFFDIKKARKKVGEIFFGKKKMTKTCFYGTKKKSINHARVFCKFRLLSNIKFTNIKFVTPVSS